MRGKIKYKNPRERQEQRRKQKDNNSGACQDLHSVSVYYGATWRNIIQQRSRELMRSPLPRQGGLPRRVLQCHTDVVLVMTTCIERCMYSMVMAHHRSSAAQRIHLELRNRCFPSTRQLVDYLTRLEAFFGDYRPHKQHTTTVVYRPWANYPRLPSPFWQEKLIPTNRLRSDALRYTNARVCRQQARWVVPYYLRTLLRIPTDTYHDWPQKFPNLASLPSLLPYLPWLP